MRRIYLPWMITVFGAFATTYGSYLLAYHFNHGNGLSIPALLLLVFGLPALGFAIAWFVSDYINKKKKKIEVVEIKEENIEQEKEAVSYKENETKVAVSEKEEPTKKPTVNKEYTPRTKVTYNSSSSYSETTVYVKQVGYGPLLRINGVRILDMRNNTYYHLENNMVMQEGYGPVFEISGNQIKDAFGGYLYELSGSNINKVFGGFCASISGNTISLYDASERYEMTGTLNARQILAVAALLFGTY